MRVLIGLEGIKRELSVEVDMSEDELFALVKRCVSDKSTLDLTDPGGQRVLIPGERIGYVLIATEKPRAVGFTAHLTN